MDRLIESQVESPMLRMLEPVATKLGTFTYHIPDNMPCLRYDKVRVKPYAGDVTLHNQTYKFKIPNYGTLLAAHTKFNFDITATGSLASTTTSTGPYPMYQYVENSVMRTRTRPIETIFGRQLHIEDTMRLREGSDSYAYGVYVDDEQSMLTTDVISAGGSLDDAIVMSGVNVTNANFINAGKTLKAVGYFKNQFQWFGRPALAYNTGVTEPLEIHVTTSGQDCFFHRGDTNWAATVTPTGVELILHFLVFHDTTYSDILRQNFRPNTPAVVFSRDTERLSVTPHTTATQHIINLQTRHLVFGLSVASFGVGGSTADPGYPTDAAHSKDHTIKFSSVRLEHSHGVIYDGAGTENWIIDSFYVDIQTNQRNRNASNFMPYANQREATDTKLSMYYIRFGLTEDTRYNSGCIAFRTIDSPRLILGSLGETPGDSTTNEIHVYACYHALNQISSETGEVIRTFDQ